MRFTSFFLAAFFSLSLWSGMTVAETILIPSTDAQPPLAAYNPSHAKWDGLGVYEGSRGTVSWKFDVPKGKGGKYNVQVLYASGELRPSLLTLKYGKSGSDNPEFSFKDVLGEITGGFFATHLKWVSLGEAELTEGEWRLKLDFKGSMPHIRGFRLTTDNDTPKGDVFKEAILAETKQRAAEQNAAAAANRKKTTEMLSGVKEILFIKRATFQSSHYYTDFIDGTRIFGTELCVLDLDTGNVRSLVPSLKEGIIGRCNISFDGKKAIFDYKKDGNEGFRIWEVNLDGTGLKQLTFPPDDEQERIVKYRLDTRGHRHWAGPTTYKHFTDDMHPAYLPEGGFVFASTRCEYGILCDGPDYLTVSVLYKAIPDAKDKTGFRLEKLTNNALSESAPNIMEDGRILYTRWEYIDNGSVTNKGLWAMNPDGSTTNEIYGRNIAFPSVFNTARQIPGAPHKFVCIGAPHMPLGVGTVLLVDDTFNRRTVEGVKYITPEVDQQHQSTWCRAPVDKPFEHLYEHSTVKNSQVQVRGDRNDHSGGGNTDAGPLYMDPYPIDEHNFLVSHNPNKRWSDVDAWALYLINDKGERDLLFKPEKFSAWNPIPVRAVPVPGVPQGLRLSDTKEKNLAQLVVVDVYAGMDNVKRGTIKWLRVNEHVPRPWSSRRYWGGDEYDQQHSVVTKNTHLGLKAQYGVVKVENDGSANFYVPADKNIFLQALDENYREVQRERTFVNYRPGELRSCVGCHEQASALKSMNGPVRAIALKRAPEMPGPQPGEVSGSRPLSYFDDVQPVLDKHCVQCHNEKCGEKQGDLPPARLNLTGELTERFNRSYETLMDWNAMPVIRENAPKAGNNHYLPPKTLGSYSSRLVSLLDKGHYDVKLPLEDMIKITTWVDSNGQYYGSYFGRRNLRYKDHPNFRPKPTFQEIQTNIPPIKDGP
jgi:hypothetical protein